MNRLSRCYATLTPAFSGPRPTHFKDSFQKVVESLKCVCFFQKNKKTNNLYCFFCFFSFFCVFEGFFSIFQEIFEKKAKILEKLKKNLQKHKKNEKNHKKQDKFVRSDQKSDLSAKLDCDGSEAKKVEKWHFGGGRKTEKVGFLQIEPLVNSTRTRDCYPPLA